MKCNIIIRNTGIIIIIRKMGNNTIIISIISHTNKLVINKMAILEMEEVKKRRLIYIIRILSKSNTKTMNLTKNKHYHNQNKMKKKYKSLKIIRIKIIMILELSELLEVMKEGKLRMNLR